MFDYWHSGWLFFLALFFKLVLLAVTLIFIYYFRPIWLIYVWKWYKIYRAGLRKHHLKITDELEICYLERKGEANGQVLLFVHGFTGDKEIFCDLVYYLPARFHAILMDLPGHGESKPDDNKSDYRPTMFVDYVHKFVRALGFGDHQKLNVIGASMGGAIAGIYAARYGHETLSSVSLVCPAGITSPEETDFVKKSRDDISKNVEGNMLLPNSVEEFKKMIHLVMYHKVNIPPHICQVFLSLKQLRTDVNKKVMRDMIIEDQRTLMDDSLEKIQQPLLCVWGKHDEILHVSGSDVIKQRVKNAEVHLIDRCGHAITLDRPRKLVKILTQFFEKVSAS